jgi:hypothetical protein
MAQGELVSFSTPPSAGFAQVFDTTGLQQAMERKEIRADKKAAEKAKADKAAQDAALKRRDKYIDKLEDFQIGALNDKFKDHLIAEIKGMEDYFKKNAAALTSANPDYNIDIEFKSKYNKLMNKIQAATTMTEGFRSELERMGSDQAYNTDDNWDLYNKLIEGSVPVGDDEAFRNATNMNSLQNFTRAFDVSAAQKRVIERLGSVTKSEVAGMKDPDFIKETKTESYNLGKIKEILKEEMDDFSREYAKKYATETGDPTVTEDEIIDHFANKFWKESQTVTEDIQRAPSDAGTGEQPKGAFTETGSIIVGGATDKEGKATTVEFSGLNVFSPDSRKKIEVQLGGKVLDTESGEMVDYGKGGQLTTIIPSKSLVLNTSAEELDGNKPMPKFLADKMKEIDPSMVGNRRFILAHTIERVDGENLNEEELGALDRAEGAGPADDDSGNTFIEALAALGKNKDQYVKRSILVPYDFAKTEFEAAFRYKPADSKLSQSERVKEEKKATKKNVGGSEMTEDEFLLEFARRNKRELTEAQKETLRERFRNL